MQRSPERVEFLASVVITAVEGGTGYWAQVSEYQWIMECAGTKLNGGLLNGSEAITDEADTYAVLHEVDDDSEFGYSETPLRVDIDVIARGIGRIKRGEVGVGRSIKADILLGDAENDGGCIDALAADVIVQAALFNEVRYG